MSGSYASRRASRSVSRTGSGWAAAAPSGSSGLWVVYPQALSRWRAPSPHLFWCRRAAPAAAARADSGVGRSGSPSFDEQIGTTAPPRPTPLLTRWRPHTTAGTGATPSRRASTPSSPRTTSCPGPAPSSTCVRRPRTATPTPPPRRARRSPARRRAASTSPSPRATMSRCAASTLHSTRPFKCFCPYPPRHATPWVPPLSV